MQERMRAAAHHRGQMLTVLRPASHVQAGCYVGAGRSPEAASSASPAATTGAASAAAAAGAPSTADDAAADLVPVQLPTGSVRISLGYLSTFEDVYAFVQFLKDAFMDEKSVMLMAKSALELELETPADAYC